MIGYTTLGTNNLEKATAFYDALFEDLSLKKIIPNDRLTLWSSKAGSAMLGVITPFDGEPATCGNGNMVAILVKDAETVARLHAKAIELGGHDEGEVGPRASMIFGYFRDLDGNKLAFYAMN